MGLIEMENNLIKSFFSENAELLDSMESYLLVLEENKTDEESIHSVFRAVHTIKGNSGIFGFDDIVGFTHIFENILDQTRNGNIIIDDDLISLFLDGHDYLKLLIDHRKEGKDEEFDQSIKENGDEICSRFLEYNQSFNNSFMNDHSQEINVETKASNEELSKDEDVLNVVNEYWHISLRLDEGVFKVGLDPYSFIAYLSEKGEIINLKTVLDNIPEGESMDPELCYLGFEIDFKTDLDKSSILNIFDFLLDDCMISIIPPKSSIYEYIRLIENLPETTLKIGEMLIETGSLTEYELDKALELQKKVPHSGKENSSLVGEILVQEKMVPQKILDAAVEKQKMIRKNENAGKSVIKVDPEKLDSLINLIGELVITGANVKQISMSEYKNGLVKAVTDMSKLIDEIRDSTMGIRMIQIGETFSRFKRMVRDLSRDQNKKIKLTISGGETELDKTLVDKIVDPLVHLIRNSIDHGILVPEERIKKGKNEEGEIKLSAAHETGSVIIEVSDDGNGLDRDKIYCKCVEKGLIESDQKISDYDLFQYIFQAGFSTADEVTNISGRGVGMDVVKKNIESLRGTISLESIKYEGTTFRIILPLTLAIIDGFMVKVGEFYFIIPLELVTECTEVSAEDVGRHESGNYLNLRGDVLPFMIMRDFIKEEGVSPEHPKVIVLEYARKKAGLVVDHLIGEFQTVIKPLGKIFQNLKWVSGSTILGTGEIAYILDVPNLLNIIQEN